MGDDTLDEAVTGIAARVAAADVDDLGGVLRDALAELGPLLRVDRAYLVAVENPGGRVALADEWCAPGSPPALSTVLTMGPLSAEEEIRRKLSSLGVKSVLMVPSRPGGSLTGTVFTTSSLESYAPSRDVVTALEVVVDAFIARLVGIKAEQGKLAMRTQLGNPYRRELSSGDE